MAEHCRGGQDDEGAQCCAGGTRDGSARPGDLLGGEDKGGALAGRSDLRRAGDQGVRQESDRRHMCQQRRCPRPGQREADRHRHGEGSGEGRYT